MRKASFLGLLWTLFISEVRAAADPTEERYSLVEGQTLTVGCPFNIMKYTYSQKAWQRLQAGGEPVTLAVTPKSSGKPSRVKEGNLIMEDDADEAMLHVNMTNLRVEDSGLYRCVIYHPPKDPVLLFKPVRLVVTKDPSGTPGSDMIPTQNMAKVSTSTTTKDPKIVYTIYATVIRTQRKSTTVVSSPNPGVTKAMDVTRISTFSIVVPVVCGFLSKTLVFLVLFAVTRRSFR